MKTKKAYLYQHPKPVTIKITLIIASVFMVLMLILGMNLGGALFYFFVICCFGYGMMWNSFLLRVDHHFVYLIFFSFWKKRRKIPLKTIKEIYTQDNLTGGNDIGKDSIFLTFTNARGKEQTIEFFADHKGDLTAFFYIIYQQTGVKVTHQGKNPPSFLKKMLGAVSFLDIDI